VVDSLFTVAIAGHGDASKTWHEALRRIEASAPATFLYAPVYVFAVHQRYRDVTIKPESSWIALWRWSVRTETRRAAGSR
jgi:hypothetical protein